MKQKSIAGVVVLTVLLFGLLMGAVYAQGPALNVSKTVSGPGGTLILPVGDVVTYTIVISNAGPGVAQQVVVTDTLPAGVIFGGWINQGSALLPGSVTLPGGGTANLPAGTLAWGPWDVAAGQEYPLVFTATVENSTDWYRQVITNTAYYLSLNADSGSAAAAFTVEQGMYTLYLPVIMKNYSVN